jgi:hypothetical protein
MLMMDHNLIEGYFKIRLQNEPLEDILETFDIDPLELLLELYDRGQIDEENI